MKALFLVFALFASACGASATTSEVPRRMGGSTRLGRFVSASSYEAFIRAERAISRNELEEAIYYYRYALSGASEDPLVYARLALAFDAAGQRNEANESLDRAFRLDADSEAAWLARGEIATRHGEHDAAIAAYEHAAGDPLHSVDATLALANVLRAANQNARADAVLVALTQREGEGALAAAKARLSLAVARDDANAILAAARDVLRIAPMTSTELRALARRLLDGGNARGSLQLLSAIPDVEEDAPLRVRALLLTGRHAEVESFLATHQVRDLGSTLEIAKIYLAARRPERALELAEGALLEGESAEAHFVAGQAAFESFANDRAALHLAVIPEGSHDFAASRLLLARVLVSEGMHEEAIEVLATTSARLPEDAALRNELDALRRAP